MTYLDNIAAQPQVLREVVQRYQQPETWESLEIIQAATPEIILTGMGASYQALLPTWLSLSQQGIAATWIEAGELLHYGLGVLQRATLLVVVSQSGESIEIQRLVTAVAGKVPIVSVTNTADNYLANHSQLKLFTAAGQEVGVATKTYTSSLALLYLLSQHLLKSPPLSQSAQQLLEVADQMQSLLNRDPDWLQPAFAHLVGATHFAFIGRGASLASAMNGALVWQETTRQFASSYSGGQFRHGPMEAVSEQLGVIVLATSLTTQPLMINLAADIASHGGRVVVLGPQGTVGPPSENLPIYLPLPTVQPEAMSPLLEALPLQLLAGLFAEKLGITPGQFRWSGKVISAE